jgi:hypothetical protein
MSYQHEAGPNAHGVGVTEEQIHVASGIRNSTLNVVVQRSLTGIISSVGTDIGTAGGIRSSGFATSLRLSSSSAWNPVMAVPQTPLVFIYAVSLIAFPTTVEFRIKMTGLDQFGNRIQEITPWQSKTQTTTSQMILFCMSKVFSVIDDCWIDTNNITNAASISNAAIGWGPIADPTGLEASAVTDNPSAANVAWVSGGATGTNTDLVGTEANWGVGTPMRVAPYGPAIPFPSPEYLGGTVSLVREVNTPALLNAVAVVEGRDQPTAGVVPVTGFALGRSAAGFQGTPHKLGFFSNDAWTTKITGIGLTGSSTRASGIPTAYVHTIEDAIQINVALRTTLGTQRDANATSSYPNG